MGDMAMEPMDSMPGMDMGNMSMDHGSTPGKNMGQDSMSSMGNTNAPDAPRAGSVGVDNVAMMPTERLDKAGEGFPPGRRVLSYADLKARKPGADPRPPTGDPENGIPHRDERIEFA